MMRTNESWMAPGFDFALRQIEMDPQSGTRTTELVRLDQTDPPISTFQPPEDYEVVVEELREVPCAQSNP